MSRAADAPADIDPVARALIRRKVPRLVGRFGFTPSDADDLAQELALRAHVAGLRFDPGRSGGFRFYDRALTNKVRSIIAGARCQKRDWRRERSLDDRCVIGGRDVADDMALALDVADALEGLAPADRDVARLLVADTVAGVARWTGMTRGQVRGAKRRIAAALAAKNLAPEIRDREPSRAPTRYVLVEGVNRVRNSRSTGREAEVVGVPPSPGVAERVPGERSARVPSPVGSCLFEFTPGVRMDEAEATFRLALLATESLHGADRVSLEAVYKVDAGSHTIEVDRASVVGSTLALIYLGYARREFGQDAFRMRRVHGATAGGEGER